MKNGLRWSKTSRKKKNGNKCWYKNGLLHREDGSAVELADGDREYYYNGIWYPEIKTDEGWIAIVKKLKKEK